MMQPTVTPDASALRRMLHFSAAKIDRARDLILSLTTHPPLEREMYILAASRLAAILRGEQP